jgi:hypothetical protein
MAMAAVTATKVATIAADNRLGNDSNGNCNTIAATIAADNRLDTSWQWQWQR